MNLFMIHPSRLILILLFFLLTPGYQPADAQQPDKLPSSKRAKAVLESIDPGTHKLKFKNDGRMRHCRLYVPPGLAGKSEIPLVIVLHGGGGSGERIQRLCNMDPVADANAFLVAYPDGTRGLGGGNTWNGGDCCGVAMRRRVDDVGFISALIDTLVAQYAADPARVYATGISNGAIMAYRLACELSNKIAAVAPIAGVLMFSECEPARPVPVMIIQGREDRAVPIEGGWNWKSQARRAFPAIETLIQTWLRLDHCQLSRTKIYEKGEVVCWQYAPCDEGGEVVYCDVKNGGHTWPGGEPFLPQLLGATSEDLNASEEMWNFFKRHTIH